MKRAGSVLAVGGPDLSTCRAASVGSAAESVGDAGASGARADQMLVPISAITVFIAVFAIATARKVHLGVLMFPAACGVGVLLAGMPLKDVVGGFPVGIMVLLLGVTYFFGTVIFDARASSPRVTVTFH